MKAVHEFFQKSFVGKSLQIVIRFDFIHNRQRDAPSHPESLPFRSNPSAAAKNFRRPRFPLRSPSATSAVKLVCFLHAPKSRVGDRVEKVSAKVGASSARSRMTTVPANISPMRWSRLLIKIASNRSNKPADKTRNSVENPQKISRHRFPERNRATVFANHAQLQQAFCPASARSRAIQKR